MRRATAKACYELLAELLLYPEDRDEARLRDLASRVRAAPAAVRTPLLELLESPDARDCERYLATMEMAPSCPLYLGHYLFEEPSSCRGAASSGRNRYMIEMAGIYHHFGLDLIGAEVADYLPLVLEFLSLSLDRPDRNASGLRERLLQRYVRPALEPMRVRFGVAGGVWVLALHALQAMLEWEMPADTQSAATSGPARRELPVLRNEACV